MNKSFLIFLFTVSLVGIAFFGCAKSAPRTDVTLELTSPDTIEALVEKDLNTIGTSYQDIDNYPESTPAQVTYVDSVEMQKPLSVQNDDSLYRDETAINDSYVVSSGNVNVWGPSSDKTLEPLSERESISVLPPPTGDVSSASGSDSFASQGSDVTYTEPTTKTTLQPKPAQARHRDHRRDRSRFRLRLPGPGRPVLWRLRRDQRRDFRRQLHRASRRHPHQDRQEIRP